MNNNKIIVICGPTATGKSLLAVSLAKDLAKKGIGVEIISTDSRQVYRGLDIGSAKITLSEMQTIPHHLINVANPSEVFTVSQFQELAQQAVSQIRSRGNLPILCGGTGLYISSVIDGTQFPNVPPNAGLRAELSLLSISELFEQLEKINPERARTVDKLNKVRLIRALEIPPEKLTIPTKSTAETSVLMIGLTLPKEELLTHIIARIDARIPDLFDEITSLHKSGISWERLESFGLEYRHGAEYLQKKINLDEFKKILSVRTWQYVKRQLTWFKRDQRIYWMNPISDKQKISDLVQDFINEYDTISST